MARSCAAPQRLDEEDFPNPKVMLSDLTHEELTALVAENLKQHSLPQARMGLGSDDASDCRKQIIELLGLSKPKSIAFYGVSSKANAAFDGGILP